MDDETLYTIGALAERTGLTVKTIRFYSDRGIVPPTMHSPAGYRLYDIDALTRLELVRTLRDLGVDLATVRRVLDREVSVRQVAAAHADALDVQIRVLRTRRAVLRAVAERGSDSREMELMHKLAKLSATERQRLVHEFVDDTFGRADANPAMMELVRTTMPELPDEPRTEQIEAWMDLVELIGDEDFRAAIRRMAEYQARERAAGDDTGLHHDLTEAVRDEVGRAVADGITPGSAAADAIIDKLTARYAETFGRPDGPAMREWIIERLEVANDPRVERYWRLVAVINDWPELPDLAPIFGWFGEALRAR
ncbi:MerR family transcriptional regulator [Nocardia sp. NPDC051030]|uniref:MerR family transcriptional regulator n=1 Tax=Nocardia sp. NPDC051030 TaxID=3155162 RepID=UPI003418F2DC